MVGKREKESKALMKKMAAVNEVKVDVDSLYERFQKFQVSAIPNNTNK